MRKTKTCLPQAGLTKYYINQAAIKWYNETKGFNYIINDENKKNIFFHKTGLASKRILTEGQKAQFNNASKKNLLLAILKPIG